MFDDKGYIPSRFLISSFPIISPKKYSPILCSFEKPPFKKPSEIQIEEGKENKDENEEGQGVIRRIDEWRKPKERRMQEEKKIESRHIRNKSKKLKEFLFPNLKEEEENRKDGSEIAESFLKLPNFITTRTNLKSQQQSRQIKLIKEKIKSSFLMFKEMCSDNNHLKSLIYSPKREDLYKQVNEYLILLCKY
jgi:hypothetical protein